MEYGQLKAAYRDQVRGTGKETGEQRQALRGASENLRVEATDLLRLAGRVCCLPRTSASTPGWPCAASLFSWMDGFQKPFSNHVILEWNVVYASEALLHMPIPSCETTTSMKGIPWGAGRRYKQAFEIAEGADRRHDSNRALQNWIQSIILRAGLAASSEVRHCNQSHVVISLLCIPCHCPPPPPPRRSPIAHHSISYPSCRLSSSFIASIHLRSCIRLSSH